MSRRGPGIRTRAGTSGGGLLAPPPDPATALASPAAARSGAPRWRDPRLLVGIVVVAACTLLGARLLSSADDSVGVWAARDTLGTGQVLTTDDVVRREVRFQNQADADRYLSADEDLPSSAVATRSVGAGELLPRAALGRAGDLPTTQLPLSVPADAVPATVQAGSSVDVWVTPERPGAGAGRVAPRSRLVLDDVTVVAAPDESGSLGPTTTRQVVVAVPSATTRLSRSIAALSAGEVLLTVQR